jgi:hypothetical protein
MTNTIWTDKEWGNHLDITHHLDGTFELGLTHVDDVGIDDGEGDGYSMAKLTAEDLIGIAAALLNVAIEGVAT